MNVPFVRKIVVNIVLLLPFGFVIAGIYLYEFLPKHASHHYDAASGAIYEVGMNGTTVFLTLGQHLLNIGVFCGGVVSIGAVAALRRRWHLDKTTANI